MLENLEAGGSHLNTTRRSKDCARHSVLCARQSYSCQPSKEYRAVNNGKEMSTEGSWISCPCVL